MNTLMLLFVAAAAISHVSSIQSPVNLRTAANYVILAQSGITTTGATDIVGHIAVSPAAEASMTGFGQTTDSGGTFSVSDIVKGKMYAANNAAPTPATLTQAISDQVAAYGDAAGRTNPDKLNYGINGPSTLSAGLYKWTAPLTVDGSITLNGDSSSVYVFQVDGTLRFTGTSNIILSNNVQPSNVIWQSAGAVTLDAGSRVQGIILGKTGITFGSGAKLVRGRALAQTAVTLIANSIREP